MKEINIDNWNRRKHYEFFKHLDYPHFNICSNVDITKFYKYIKDNDIPFFISMVHITTKIANELESFKYRIRGDKVVIHDKVNTAFTIMSDDGVFSFCNGKYVNSFKEFYTETKKAIEKTKENILLEDEKGIDDVVYMTSLPWVSFTSVSHPIHMTPVDSIPRIAWGKYFNDGEKILMPLAVQVHHALVDGNEVGQYFDRIQKLLDNPNEIYNL